MTPKEKAKELVEKLKELRNYSSYAYSLCNSTVTQCAIIAVDEIIKNLHWLEDSINFDKAIKFWQEVKTELNKLQDEKRII